MNLQDLANLVLVRNHLAYLLNNERNVVSKDQVRPADVLKSAMDRLILEESFNLDLEGISRGGVPYTIVEKQPKQKKQIVQKPNVEVVDKAVVVSPPSNQLELPFDDAKAEEDAEAAEIAAKIAKAKQTVKDKKKGGGFSRTSE